MHSKSSKDTFNRSTFAGWKRWMQGNPWYFDMVFQKEPTEANLNAIGQKIFGKHKRLNEAMEFHRHPQRPVARGLVEIGQTVGVSRDSIMRHFRRDPFPHWKEDKKICAYIGRLHRWAKARKLGKYKECAA